LLFFVQGQRCLNIQGLTVFGTEHSCYFTCICIVRASNLGHEIDYRGGLFCGIYQLH